MTQDQLDSIKAELGLAVDWAGNLVGAIDPALIPFIVIGKAVGKAIPDLVSDVHNWIEGNPPTAEEKAAFAQKLSVLSDPNLP